MEKITCDPWFYQVIALCAIWICAQIVVEIIKNKIRNYNRRTYEQKNGSTMQTLPPELVENFLNLFAKHIETQQAILDTLKSNGSILAEHKAILLEEKKAIEDHCEKADKARGHIWEMHRILTSKA